MFLSLIIWSLHRACESPRDQSSSPLSLAINYKRETEKYYQWRKHYCHGCQLSVEVGCVVMKLGFVDIMCSVTKCVKCEVCALFYFL